MKTVMLVIVWCVCLWNKGYSQTASRIPISAIYPTIATGQDYNPWLNDDITNLVTNVWSSPNMRWVDVKLKLASRASVNKLSLYDFEGTCGTTPAQIYAVTGTTKTLIGTFTGSLYMQWVNINLSTPVTADTIVIHKYANCIPQKVQVYGFPTSGGSSGMTIGGSSTICRGASAPLSCATTGGNWTSGNTAIATVGYTTGIVNGVAAGTATITYNHSGAIATKVVSVNPTPTCGTIWGTGAITVGGWTTLTNATTGGVWSNSSPAVATISTSGDVLGVAAGSATIDYTVTNACGTAVATKVITVSGSTGGGATISGTATVCAGSTTALSASPAGGAWSSSSTGVATVGATGVVTGVSAGTSTISYTAGGATATRVVTVNGVPSAGTISGTATVGAGSATTLTSTVSGGAWSSSATGIVTVSSAGVVTGVAAGTATISYVVTNSCGTATATKVVTVSAAPSSGVISGTATVCAGATTALSSSVSGGTWSSTATSVATVGATGIVTGVSAGTSTISYVVSGVATTKVVTVNTLPSAGTITGTAIVTAGSATVLSNATAGGTWSSSSASIATVSSAGTVTGVAAGTATISYAVSNSCGSAVATKVVTVSAATSGGGTTPGSGSWVYGKIPFDVKRWYQLNNCANGLEGLFDNNLTATVSTGYGKILTNFDAYYPVQSANGERMNIDSIKFYDGPGSNETAPFKLYYIDSNWNRILLATYIGNQYNMWVGPNAATPSNYALAVPAHGVRFLVINCSSSYPFEMQLYGSYMAPAPTLAPTPRPIKLKQELGANAFEWDFLLPSSPLVINETRMNAVKSFGTIRHYLDWEKLEPTAGGYTFNPSHSGGWNMDVIYQRAKAEGIEMLVDIKTLPGWLRSTWSPSADNENVPVTGGSDFANPNSYLKQAKMAFQFAARYGYNTSVSPSLLSVDASTRWSGDPANTVKIGLGYIKYIECDNERDKWWKGRNAYQTGREYAANMSAFYDGHKGTMGAGVGVKNADPSMQVVMGGVALPTVDYLMGMIDWCKEFRGYKADGSVNLCWDVINYHIYPDNYKSMQGGGTRGSAPEVAHADSFAKRFVDCARKYSQNMAVWVTETGYDRNAGSPVKAIAIGSRTVQQTQADWSLRNSLMYARMGVERTFFYMMDDVDSNSTTQFASSGLVYPNYSRRPVADFMYQTKRLMGEYVYKETISTNPMVDRYELDGRSAYVLVKPTENGSTMSYTLSLPMTTGTAKIYKPTQGQDSMALSTAPISGSSITLTVTETPVFVMPYASSPRPADEESTVTNDVLPQSEVMVYPNPTTGVVNFVIDNSTQGELPVTIYTEAGQVCKTFVMSKPAGKFSNAVDLSYLPNGLYIVEIGKGNDRVTKKVIKVK